MAIPNFAADIEAELRACLPDSPETPAFHGMMRYPFGWVDRDLKPKTSPSGKGIRPTVCLLACQAAGGDYRQALPAAATLEIIHNFSLVHDDIQDRSPERRGRPSVWAIWGEAQAINIGDAIFVAGRRALSRLRDQGVKDETVLEAIQALDSACLSLCEGQYLDMDFEVRPEVSETEYYSMVSRKTGALLGCSAQLGALVATGDSAVAGQYRRFGEALGIAFQVEDDILGIWGDPTVTGKPAGDDIIYRKKTLPVLFARRWANEVIRQVGQVQGRAVDDSRFADATCILEHYHQPNSVEAPVEPVAEAMARCGAQAYAGRAAREWYENALVALAAAGPSEPAGGDLRELSAALVGRKT